MGKKEGETNLTPKVADNLKNIRKTMNLTQNQMAEILGYSLSGYIKIENGSRGLPIHKAMKASEILNCSLDEIFLPNDVPNRVRNNKKIDK